jgi:tetratricopeptide (TPR) repeat protein
VARDAKELSNPAGCRLMAGSTNMPDDSNTPGASPPDPRLEALRAKLGRLRAKEAAAKEKAPAPASSKILQVFLLLALVITGVAYVLNQWMDTATDEVKSHPNPLRRRVENQNEFLTETDLGRKAEAKKQYTEAVAHYRRALLGEVNTEGRVNLGNALLKQGNPDMAFAQFKEAIHDDPGAEPAYLAWGEGLTLEGKLDDAIALYQDALRQNPKFAGVHNQFALALEQKQQAAEAAERTAAAAQQTAAADKSAAEAQLYGSDAVKHYAEAERLGFNTPEFWCGYGALLNKLGQYRDAMPRLSKAVMQKPGSGSAQFQLAIAQGHLGDYAGAIGHYEAALAALPDDPATLNNLALLYCTATNQEVRSSKMAILLATRACDATSSQDAHYMDTLARAYAADGDFLQAITWEEKAVRRATQLVDHDLLRDLQSRFNLFVQHRAE